jgi:hypothetical protein
MGGTSAKQDYLRYRDEAAAKKAPNTFDVDQAPYAKFDDRTANSYRRESSKPASESEVKKESAQVMKNPMSSYDAIDSGLGK